MNNKILVNTEKPYNINFCNNVIDRLKADFPNRKYFIITDENVYKNCKIFSNDENVFIIQPGEESKSFSNYESLSLQLLEKNIDRNSLIIGFGGGVVGDLSGFVASTILRGVDFIQIPTTLLAMVDSSVGGKVAINTKFGKNLIGAFYQPKAVYINIDFLKTLPKRYFTDGMGEVIKYALIYDKDMINYLDDVEKIIYRSCEIKAKIVSLDEKDNGIRKILNFGHTIGHSVEKYYNFTKYSHGEAVAIGMYYMASLSEKLGIASNISGFVKDILIKYNLPYELDIPKENLLDYIKKDKKVSNNKIDCILLEEIGKAVIKKLEIEDIIN